MIYRLFFKLFLLRMDAERAHSLAARVLRTMAFPAVDALVRPFTHRKDGGLRVEALGLTFPNPLGVAAGMDKEANCFDGFGTIGFGFVEVGTITAKPQEGTSGKRIWRLSKDRALLNAMGFPNPGAAVAAERVRAGSGRTLVGVNVGKSSDVAVGAAGEDYRAAVRQLAPVADYLVLNVSSPNTPGLRDMQAIETLAALIADVRQELDEIGAPRPLLVKIAPDLTAVEIDAIADLAVQLELDGIVAINTTVDRSVLVSPEPSDAAGRGGISGAPLKARALAVLRQLYARVGDKLVLISVGGIEDADDAWERILAGATLLQAHTGFVYGGPVWARRVNRGLAKRVREAGASSIQDLIGSAARPLRSESVSTRSGLTPAAPAEVVAAGPAAMVTHPLV